MRSILFLAFLFVIAAKAALNPIYANAAGKDGAVSLTGAGSSSVVFGTYDKYGFVSQNATSYGPSAGSASRQKVVTEVTGTLTTTCAGWTVMGGGWSASVSVLRNGVDVGIKFAPSAPQAGTHTFTLSDAGSFSNSLVYSVVGSITKGANPSQPTQPDCSISLSNVGYTYYVISAI